MGSVGFRVRGSGFGVGRSRRAGGDQRFACLLFSHLQARSALYMRRITPLPKQP